MEEEKICFVCKNSFKKRNNEYYYNFQNRQTCGKSCAAKLRLVKINPLKYQLTLTCDVCGRRELKQGEFVDTQLDDDIQEIFCLDCYRDALGGWLPKFDNLLFIDLN